MTSSEPMEKTAASDSNIRTACSRAFSTKKPKCGVLAETDMLSGNYAFERIGGQNNTFLGRLRRGRCLTLAGSLSVTEEAADR